ncbi:MAG: hypothetical protein RDV41_09710 [Planctomycetota bacterium]|nr:hypothetical protein [Planctomycetota bacterium]
MRYSTAVACVLVVVFAGALAVRAEETLQGYDSLKPGKRVELVLTNGSSFKGDVVSVNAEKVTLNLRRERSEAAGTMAFKKAEIAFIDLFDATPGASGAVAASKQDSPEGYDALRPGKQQRVEIVLKNNSTFKGEVAAVSKTKVTLNLSFEKLDVQGYMGFERREIKRIVFLEALTREEKSRIEAGRMDLGGGAGSGEGPAAGTKEATKEDTKETAEKRKQYLLDKFPASTWTADTKAEIAAKPASSRTQEEQEFLDCYDEIVKAREDTGKQSRADLLKKFPPDQGWGEEKYQELLKKELWITGVQRTTEEDDFVVNYEDWKVAYQEAAAAGATEEKPAGPGAGTSQPATEEGAGTSEETPSETTGETSGESPGSSGVPPVPPRRPPR